jgi:D-alanyl-D-alanine carboxypeptidase
MTNTAPRHGHGSSGWRSATRRRAVVAALAAVLALAGTVAATAATAGAATRPARAGAAGRLDAATTARLARTLQRTWTATWAPGVIVGVWVGNRGWTAVRGSIKRAAGPRPVLAEHTRVGSVTKTMVGTLILELVDEGKLRLDETIQRWFPKLRDARALTTRRPTS